MLKHAQPCEELAPISHSHALILFTLFRSARVLGQGRALLPY